MGIFNLLREGRARLTKEQYDKHAKELMGRVGEALAEKDYTRTAWLYQLLARMCRTRKDYDQCLDHLMHGIEYSEKTGNDFSTGWLYRIASHAAREKGDYSKAVQYALKGVGYFKKAGSVYAMQWCYNLAARASALKGDLYSAIGYLEKSLEIEDDKEVRKELEGLKAKVPHPEVSVSSSRERVREGEACRFTATVRNRGKLVLRGIKLADRKGRVLDRLDRLYPGDSKALSQEYTGKLGIMHSRYRKVLWQGPQGVLEREIGPLEVRVVPNLEVSTSINPKLRLGRPSDFVVLIRNRSSSPVLDVKLRMGFPKEMRARRETQDSFESIGPGEEKGMVYTLIPTIVGESVERNAGIEYSDEAGNKYQESITPVVFRGALEGEPLPSRTKSEVEKMLGPEGLKHLERARKKRGYIQGLVTANPLSEAEYLALKGRFPSCSRGFTLGGVSLDTISEHILKECSVFTLIGMREFRNERLFLFSGRSRNELRTWLLTSAVKKDGRAYNVLFTAYSDKKKGLREFLDNIADIVKYTIITMNFAKEVEKIEVKKVITIIDSIVQRSNIGGNGGELKSKKIRIKDSVVQRAGV